MSIAINAEPVPLLTDKLSEIVKHNWTTFSNTFTSEGAFTKIMGSLNLLRGAIAHSCPLPKKEIERLRITVDDWFSLMK